MATKIAQGQKAGPLSVGGFLDAAGHATTIDPNTQVTWSVSDPAKSEILDDGSGQIFVAPRLDQDPVGDAQQVIATCDADLGDGVITLLVMGDFDVPAGQAVSGTVTLGSVVPR